MIAETSKGRPLHFLGAVVVGIVFMCSASYAADPSQKPLSFSNQDLQSYESAQTEQPPQQNFPDPRAAKPKKAKTIDSREQKEGEYWCKKASKQKRKIQRLNDDISEKEEQLAKEKRSGVASSKKTATLDKGIAKYKKKLKYAEADLSALEDEAYRKGVPPGWLRCQFE